MNEKPSFFAELKRRNVYKVAVAYAVVGWLAIQAASIVLPTFHAPEWTLQTIITLVVLGFPIALVIAWAFEVTPEGIKRTEDVDASAPRERRKYTWIYIAAIGAALSIALFLLGRYTGKDERSGDSFLPQKSIAVLPFENLSEEKANAYFVEGIQDEILTKLAALRDLKVISRTSTAKYQSKPENLKVVAQELAVANVLEGSVQRSEGKVRVNVQLLDARNDVHLWAKSYDRELKDVFAVESEIAQDVADTLRTQLSPAESNALTAAPTGSTEAYDLFLKGEYEEQRAEALVTKETLDRAAAFYREAIARDPKFALAYARLGSNRLNLHWFSASLTPAELTQVKATIDRAIALAPNLPDAQLALGLYFYWGLRDYDPALATFRRAIELQPNNARARAFIGYVYRRRGEWDKSLAESARADELDPINANDVGNRGITYLLLRRWTEAEQLLRRALAIDPQSIDAVEALCKTCENSRGDLECSRRVLDSVPADNPVQFHQLRDEASGFVGARAYLDVLKRDFPRALEHWTKPLNSSAEGRRQQWEARLVIQTIAGSRAPAHAEAEALCQMHEARLKEAPDDFFALSALSWAYACLGGNSEARQMAHRATTALPYEKDAFVGAGLLVQEAQIAALTGETQQAIKSLQNVLSIPAGRFISIARLKIDPVWDGIRNDPGFQQLLTMKEHVGP